jgi:nitroreductase
MSHPKHAQADHEILDIIRARWSPRAFDPSRDVSRDDLLRLFEAARWAPSSLNEQPWRFVVGERTRSPEAHAALMSALNERNRTWAAAAPVLILVAVHRTLEQFQMENIHAWYDAGQAVAFLTIQATAQGLSIRQMEGFDRARARAICAVPEPFEPGIMMALGYVGDPENLPIEKHRASERQPRARRPIGDFVFTGTWGVRY